MIKGFIILWVCLLFSYRIFSQENLSNIRQKEIFIQHDTIVLDTLSIVPESILITQNGQIIKTDSLFIINYAKALLIIKGKENFYTKKINIKYRVFPFNFSKNYSFQKNTLILPDEVSKINKLKITANQNSKKTIFDNNIKKSGSISRGFLIGNQRDLSTVSNLNLQLSGKINDEVSVLAAISDNNLPFQPEGNTQQIQEFDNVFVQFFTKKSGIVVGDFLLSKPEGYYMNLRKKNRGIKLYSTFKLKNNYCLHSEISAGLSKGKYNRIKLKGIEGNQGPYRLTGTENEQYIIILSGSEKVFLDGELLKRGQNFDYTINYNTAELSFTQNRPITKDKRIIVEFEYALQMYPRTLVFQTNKLTNGNNSFWLNFYHHNDNKNDPLSLYYTSDVQKFLSEKGDSIQNAIYPNIRKTSYNTDAIMYEQVDTIVNGIAYDSIYRQSYNSQRAIYQLGFSYLGSNKGNYRQINSSANGKVYEWIAPINNIPQGDYEPVVLLISPKNQLLSTAGADFAIGKTGKLFTELAISNNNVNTYSVKDKNDDIGYAGKLIYNQQLISADTNQVKLMLQLKYQFADKKFRPLDNYRTVEFERDWNLDNRLNTYKEERAGVALKFFRKNLVDAGGAIEYLQAANNYLGKKALFYTNLRSKTLELDANINYLQTENKLLQTTFLRHKVILSQHFKFFTLGASENTENNLWQTKLNDSLLAKSFSFNEYEFFIHQADSALQTFFVSYKIRENKLPINQCLQTSDKSKDFSGGLTFLINKKIRINGRLNYREISYSDSMNTTLNKENTLTGRAEMQMNLAKGSFIWYSFYETGFGLENKKNYQYIEVPAGQGQFTWIDYNNNNIKELDEFEYAKYQDKANFIRIVLPSIEKEKIFLSQLNQSIALIPERIWRKSGGIKKIISHFSNRFAVRIMQKANHDDYIPDLIDNRDIISLNFDLRNIAGFKSFNRKWQIDYIFNQNKQKISLISGIEFKELQKNTWKLRYKIQKKITFFNDLIKSNKKNRSESFLLKNYNISSIEEKPALQFQPKMNWFVNLSYRYAQKTNILANEKTQISEIKFIYNQNILKKSNLQANYSLINIHYNKDASSPVAYEMLEGLLPGKNMVWELSFNKKLSEIFQLQLNYNGRMNKNSTIIHNGGLQLRASF